MTIALSLKSTSCTRYYKEDAYVLFYRPFRCNLTLKYQTKNLSSQNSCHQSFMWVLGICWICQLSALYLPSPYAQHSIQLSPSLPFRAAYSSHCQWWSKAQPKVLLDNAFICHPIVGLDVEVVVPIAPNDSAVGLDSLALGGGHDW